MDCEMPEMDGFEATRMIRHYEAAQNKEPVLIIALTAHTYHQARSSCLKSGMDSFISKPIGISQLAKCLANFLPDKQKTGQPKIHNMLPCEKEHAMAKHASKSHPLSHKPYINEKVINQLRALQRPGKAHILQKMLDLYLTESPLLLIKISEGCQLAQYEEVRKLAHTLKSSSYTLGADYLADLAKELEYKASQHTDISNYPQLLMEAFNFVNPLLEEKIKSNHQMTDKHSYQSTSKQLVLNT